MGVLTLAAAYVAMGGKPLIDFGDRGAPGSAVEV